jgi:DNA-binding IclR family transcriptional regulator
VNSAKTIARRPAKAAAAETGLTGPDVNKATVYILRVLSAFAADIPSFGVTALSKQLGMTKSMVHRALTTLLDQGYIVRDSTGSAYQLGLRRPRAAGSRLQRAGPSHALRALPATATRSRTGNRAPVRARRR